MTIGENGAIALVNNESGNERIPRSLLRGSERIMFKIPSLGIEDSPELVPEILNFNEPVRWLREFM
jgi:hypothetical protein